MDNAFRHARRPTGINNQKRVAKGNTLENELGIPLCRLQKRLECLRAAQSFYACGPPRKSGLHDYAFELCNIAHTCNQLAHLRPQVHGLAVVDCPVIGKDELWFDLHEALQDAVCAHFRAAGAEESAETDSGHEDHKRIKTCRRNGGNPVSFSHAFCAESV